MSKSLYAVVTGGAGFIGSYLVKGLLDRGQKVIIIDNFSTASEKNIDNRVSDVVALDAGKVKTSLLKETGALFHFGELAGETISFFAPQGLYLKNLTNTFQLLLKSIKAGVGKIVYASSIAVYGKSNPAPYSENGTTPSPSDPYGLAKYQAEKLIGWYATEAKIPYALLRMFNLYGPKMNLADPYRGVIAIFINQVLRGESPTIFGHGNQKRAFTYAEDIVPTIIDIGLGKGPDQLTLNLGAKAPISLNQAAKEIIAASNASVLPKYIDTPYTDDKVVYCDVTMAEHVYNFKVNTSFQTGIQETIKWAKSLEKMPDFDYDLYGKHFELRETLPSPWKTKSM